MRRNTGDCASGFFTKRIGGALERMAASVEVLTTSEQELKSLIAEKSGKRGYAFLDDFDEERQLLIFGLRDKHEVEVFRDENHVRCVKLRRAYSWIRVLTANLAA